MDARITLFEILQTRLDKKAMGFFKEKAALLSGTPQDKDVFLAFSQALRHTGKAPLVPTPHEDESARLVDAEWDLAAWTLADAGRAFLLLEMPAGPEQVRRILALHQSADLGEHVALVRALPLLSDAKALLHIAREGIRSNMGDVFTAISLRNPYPSRYFDDIAWNQLVVKCVFNDHPLRRIVGLDRRVNADLRQILCDLAQERWAAGRSISPETWRCVGPMADAAALTLMEKALASEAAPERAGAALGLWAVPGEAGQACVRRLAPHFVPRLESGALNWENYEHG